ncbi:hypothetical protein F5B20DRAFT_583678 [Whalleya microplaca]|nr:hypothetical protein F5B20DRAFT_583678 [Whalleya microplaca]
MCGHAYSNPIQHKCKGTISADGNPILCKKPGQVVNIEKVKVSARCSHCAKRPCYWRKTTSKKSADLKEEQTKLLAEAKERNEAKKSDYEAESDNKKTNTA